MESNNKVASIPERIRGAIAAALALLFLTLADNTHDAQWQVTFVIAGVCYFMTTITFMFENGMAPHHKGGDDEGEGKDKDKNKE